MPANIEQLQKQVENLRKEKDRKQKEIDDHTGIIEKLREDKDTLQRKIDDITGSMEEQDGAITTSTAGDISIAGGRGNFSPKMGMQSRNGYTKKSMMVSKKKKKKYENVVHNYIDDFLVE